MTALQWLAQGTQRQGLDRSGASGDYLFLNDRAPLSGDLPTLKCHPCVGTLPLVARAMTRNYIRLVIMYRVAFIHSIGGLGIRDKVCAAWTTTRYAPHPPTRSVFAVFGPIWHPPSRGLARALPWPMIKSWPSSGARGDKKGSDTAETCSKNRLPFAAHPFPHPNMGYGLTAAVVRFIWQRLGARVPRMR